MRRRANRIIPANNVSWSFELKGAGLTSRSEQKTARATRHSSRLLQARGIGSPLVGLVLLAERVVHLASAHNPNRRLRSSPLRLGRVSSSPLLSRKSRSPRTRDPCESIFLLRIGKTHLPVLRQSSTLRKRTHEATTPWKTQTATLPRGRLPLKPRALDAKHPTCLPEDLCGTFPFFAPPTVFSPPTVQ